MELAGKKLLFSRPLLQRPEIDGRTYGPLRPVHAGVLGFSPSGKTLAIGGRFSSVFLFDVFKKRVRYVLPLHAEQGGANALAFSPNGKRLLVAGLWNVSGASFDQIHLFSTCNGHRIWHWNNKSDDPSAYDTSALYTSAAFSSDGRRFAVANNNSLVIRDARTTRFLLMRRSEETKPPSLATQKQLFPVLVVR
ncbi:hypothetical protein IAD21_01428 [Abditibacteriota bacterium]|nr:hypothetical protein IAD21_01428 [Abditibacteriota bacterium]